MRRDPLHHELYVHGDVDQPPPDAAARGCVVASVAMIVGWVVLALAWRTLS